MIKRMIKPRRDDHGVLDSDGLRLAWAVGVPGRVVGGGVATSL